MTRTPAPLSVPVDTSSTLPSSKRTLVVSLAQGLAVLMMVMIVFGMALRWGYGEQEARALSFTTLIVANLGLIFANRSWSQTILARLGSRNWALWCVTGGAAVFLGCALYIPALRGVFKFSVLSVWDVLMCVGFGAASTVWFELLKVFKWTRARG